MHLYLHYHTLLLSLQLKLLIKKKIHRKIRKKIGKIPIHLLSVLFPFHSYLAESPHLPACTLKHMLHQEVPEIINKSIIT